MAGAFTHFMVCWEALKTIPPGMNRLIRGGRPNLFIGAVGPDLPCLAVPREKTGSLSCADYMHYYKTNGLPRAAVDSLRNSYEITSRIDRSKFAWILGYISHLIADATIHPIVEAIVGPYKRNKSEHMRCEMVQDAFVFKAAINKEIPDFWFIGRYVSYVDRSVLLFWRDLFYRTYFPGIYKLKKETRRGAAIRPGKTFRDIRGRRFRAEFIKNSVRPGRWHRWHQTLLESSTRGNFKNLMRHIGVGKNLFYRTTGEIREDTPAEYQKYFRLVRLPNRKSRANFMKAGFEPAVKNVLKGWEVACRGLEEGKDITWYIKNWDLDTGIDQKTGEMTFWV